MENQHILFKAICLLEKVLELLLNCAVLLRPLPQIFGFLSGCPLHVELCNIC